MSSTALAVRPLIELHMEASAEGEVSPVAPVTWTFSDELVAKLEKSGHKNPHLIIAVGYESAYGFEDESTEFIATKVYIHRLLDESPKEFLQFSHAGTNVVLAFVVNIKDRAAETMMRNWEQHPKDTPIGLVGKQKKYILHGAGFGSYAKPLNKPYNVASFRHDVIVPKEMFAPEPPKAVKALVRQFFRGREEDQCDFRRRFLLSLALSVPVQLYGILARFFSLIYALLFAMRGMSLRALFALNPHDFGHQLSYSFWYYTSKGRKRRNLLPWVNPPQLILYALIAGVALLPGWALVVLTHLYSLPHKDDWRVHPYTFGEVAWVSVWIDLIILVVVGLCFLAFSRKGHRLVRNTYRQLIPNAKPAVVYGDPSTFDQLRQQVHGMTNIMPNQVQNKTIRLKFLDLKMKVCKPFAR